VAFEERSERLPQLSGPVPMNDAQRARIGK
jgi:hypothetical protein